MKLAWICYAFEFDDEEELAPIIVFEEPISTFRYRKIVQIVYAEITND